MTNLFVDGQKEKTKKVFFPEQKFHYVRDPNSPNDPTEPFVYYTQHIYDDISKQNPNLTVTELSSLISQKWNQLGVGQLKYFEMSQKDHKRYEKEKIEYEKSGGEWFTSLDNLLIEHKPKQQYFNHELSPPNKPQNAFLLYHQKIRRKILHKLPVERFSQLAVLSSKKWKKLSLNQKKKFVNLSILDKQRYKRELQNYMTKSNQTPTSKTENSNNDSIQTILHNPEFSQQNNSQKTNENLQNQNLKHKPIATKYRIYFGKKPINWPKLPHTPYIYFCQDFFKLNPDLSNSKKPNINVNSVRAKRWRELTFEQKRKYYNEADNDRRRYDEEVEEFLKDKDEDFKKKHLSQESKKKSKIYSQKKKKKKLNTSNNINKNPIQKNNTDKDQINIPIPIRPKNSYFLFCDDYRNLLRKENNNIGLVEFSRLSSKAWQNLSIKKKKKYFNLEKQESIRYRNEMIQYEKDMRILNENINKNKTDDMKPETTNNKEI
ncbi:high mobility group protein dsp1 [Anaeramoeba flamelloides]|uniref:High mobility group protein dsp1 n=1 Tax=Anaeramoeba flamelloides TaxID=1746091 RepID=A0ABQ8YYK6_9EUKA|nr:high mobility group protein dsp1 [Anaeramoeba flamelloides]